MVTLLLSYLLLYKYVIIFVVIALAALVLPLPTNTLILASGAFASQGYLSFPLALATAMAANMGGDVLGYFLAARLGDRVLRVIRSHPSAYEHALERYLQRKPGAAIFFSRFAGTLDPAVNILSGWAGVSLVTFIWYDFLGNIISIGGVMYVGYVVGANWLSFVDLVSTIGYFVAAAVLLVGVIAIFGRRLGIGRLYRRATARLAAIVFGDES